MDCLNGTATKISFEEKDSDAWALFGDCAFCFRKEHFIFNPALFKTSTFLSQILPAETETLEPLVVTSAMLEKGKLTIRKLIKAEEDEIYVNEKFLKLFPSTKFTYAQKKGATLQPIFCYNKSDLLTGIVLPSNYKTTNENGGT
jgi:hypothetical protein